MRAGAVIVGAVSAAAAAFAWSCTVDRKSEGLACTSQAQCTMGRVCQMGYCVVGNRPIDAAIDARVDAPPDAFACPGVCSSCTMTSPPGCAITGSGGSSVTCPSGFHCDITCGSANACGNITCTQAKSCTITCTGGGACGSITCGSGACTASCGSGSAACGPMTCGPGACTEMCNGVGACGSLDCHTSCDCNATCSPLLACATMTCPTHGNHYCATGGMTMQPCDSTAFPQCTQNCP